jgi:hypothetical protein
MESHPGGHSEPGDPLGNVRRPTLRAWEAEADPPWAVHVGGPLDGRRVLLQPREVEQPTLVRDQAEYQVTSEYKMVKSEVWEVRTRILRFLRSLPEAS